MKNTDLSFVTRFLCVLIVAFFPTFTHADTVVQLDATADVAKNRSIHVTERITLDVSRGSRTSGVTRVFHLLGAQGGSAAITLNAVRRNGVTEYANASRSGYKYTISTGQAGVPLVPGRHEFFLEYTLTRQVALDNLTDTLDWPVTFGSWSIPVMRITASIRLPTGVAAKNSSGFMGVTGQEKSDVVEITSPDGGHVLNFTNNRALQPGENFRALAVWNSGAMEKPEIWEHHLAILRELNVKNTAMMGGGVIFFFLLMIWRNLTHDPDKDDAIVPVPRPPEKLSPLGVRVLMQRSLDSRGIAATLLNLAIKGYVHIHRHENVTTLERVTPYDPSTAILSPEEEAVDKALFPSGAGSKVPLTRKSRGLFALAKSRGYVAARRFNGVDYYSAHTGGFMLGNFMVALLIALVFTIADADMQGPLMWLSLLQSGVAVGMPLVVRSLFPRYRFQPRAWVIGAGLSSLITASLFSFALSHDLNILLVLENVEGQVCLGLVAFVAFMSLILPSATLDGMRMRRDVESFRAFLVQGYDAPKLLPDTPEPSAQIFERYYPYACVLGVERAWADQLKTYINEAITRNEFTPPWLAPSPSFGKPVFWANFSTALVKDVMKIKS